MRYCTAAAGFSAGSPRTTFGRGGEGSVGVIKRLLERRLVLVTGKGGVGKSTLAAAIGLVAARAGRRVVVCEVGGPSAVAPLLGDADVPEGQPPRPIGEGVHLAVLCAEDGIRRYLGEKIRVPGIVDLVFRQQAVSRFFRAAPAFSEMGVLYLVARLLDERDGRGRPVWDHVIVDLPASGHAVGMLEAPFVGKRIFLAGPVRALCDSIERMLIDHDLATALVVTLPEELPVNEAMELSEKLRARGLRVEAVLANAVEAEAIAPGERAILERLQAAAGQPLLEGALRAARRAARGSETLRRLEEGLRSRPVPVSWRVERGRALVREIADELEAGGRGD